MNLSTAAAVDVLNRAEHRLKASVCWWHLLVVAATSPAPIQAAACVHPWVELRTEQSLRAALKSGVIQAVAVHAIPLDDEDMLLRLISALPA
ncbi:MAG: hypothetical protein CM15mP77_3150 [Synechococcus sp.]|nr:MAG: hypothetical protein CM15mP77_3150 [Synechococcus sp.]